MIAKDQSPFDLGMMLACVFGKLNFSCASVSGLQLIFPNPICASVGAIENRSSKVTLR